LSWTEAEMFDLAPDERGGPLELLLPLPLPRFV
jgi:hypothetical protein